VGLGAFSFDGGTTGAALSDPTSSSSGTAWRLVNGLGTYAATPTKAGARSVKGDGYYLNVANSGGTVLTDYSGTDYWIDGYFRVPTGKVPGSNMLLIGGAFTMSFSGLAITSDRRFALLRASDSTVQAQTATNTVPLDAWFRVAVRYSATAGVQEARIVTSSAGDASSADYVLTYNCDAIGYMAVGLPLDCYVDELTVQDGTSTGIPTVSTTHTATASLTVTAARTATATREAVPTSSATTTATTTASATVERVGAASQTVTATITAGATAVMAVGSASTVTATITASADVVSPSTVTGDVAATTTAAITATATVERMASAALSVAAAITATLINENEVTPGTMRALTIEGATMRPAGSTAATMRVGLLGLNTATMVAVVSDEGTPTTIGVPVFAGPTDPVTAGLITAGTAHVWFHDGTVFVQE
jgi:hypothetical protein